MRTTTQRCLECDKPTEPVAVHMFFCSEECQHGREVRQALRPSGPCAFCGTITLGGVEGSRPVVLTWDEVKILDGIFCTRECWSDQVAHNIERRP